MKIAILQQDLLSVINSVSRSVGVKSTLPVLGNILLGVEDNKLKVAATNLEIGIIKYISAKVLDSGEITIPAKTIVDIVSSLGPAEITIETEGDNITISSGKFKAKINGIASSEFPVIPTTDTFLITFPKETLRGCAQILFAAASDEGRPTLTGILTQSNGGNLDFVATDGFRLAHRQVKLENKGEIKSLIPRRTFEEVLRLIDEEAVTSVEASTSKDQNQIIFKIGQTIVSSRLIEGQFPSWEKIIPTEIKTRSLIDKPAFHQAIKLASVFAKSEANIISLKVAKSSLQVSSEAKELGSQLNEVEADTEGEEIEIAFNGKFLSDVISAVPSTQLMMEFSGPLSATLIKPVGVEGLEYILMPVRIS